MCHLFFKFSVVADSSDRFDDHDESKSSISEAPDEAFVVAFLILHKLATAAASFLRIHGYFYVLRHVFEVDAASGQKAI